MRTLPPDCIEIIERFVAGQAWEGDSDNFADLMKNLGQQTRADLLCYWDSRHKGSSPLLAEMFALQAAPQPKSDATFLAAFGPNGKQFEGGPMQEETGNRLKAVAEAGGQNVKGKVYLGGLAMYPGDPRAWISDRHEAQKYIEETGRTCTGDVTVKRGMRHTEVLGKAIEAPDKPFDGGIDKTENTTGKQIVLEPVPA